jgi:hypothetical protein
MLLMSLIDAKNLQLAVKTFKEFGEEIKVREQLLMNIVMHKRDFEFLNTPGDAALIRFFSDRPIFGRSRDAIFKLLCIEVNKLFSDLKGDKFKLTQLLEKIKAQRKKAEWKDALSKGDITLIEKLIKKGLKNDSIKGLRNYRNKYLAHTDRDKAESAFFVEQFYGLIAIALEIINLLRTKVLKAEFL